jgi:DNA-binding PucR family transcriptional regulator
LRRAGVGLLLPGVAGAAASLRQAERALAVSAGCGEPVSFRSEWLPALALAQLDDVLGVLGPAVDHLRDDASLRATVSAYLSNNGQLAAAGAQLFVHPNTVAYRLGRFAERTGVDPRTSDGAVSTRLALRLSQLAGG